MHFDPPELAVIADLILWLLQDGNIADQVTQHGISLPDLKLKLLQVQETSHDSEPLLLDEPSSDYEERRRRKPATVKEKSRNIATLVNCYSKKSLTGMQLQEAFLESPKQDLVDFIMLSLLGWAPPQQRKKFPAVN
jgi:hypothetical protein